MATTQPFQMHLPTTPQKHPDHVHNNHVVLPLHKLAPDQHFLQHSGKSTFFPSTNKLKQALLRAVQRWHRQHHLPIPTPQDKEALKFVEHQLLLLHHQHLQRSLNIHIIGNAIKNIPDGVIHCEDHFPNRLMWYCPHAYYEAVGATFLDPDVFQIIDLPPLTHHLSTYNSITKLLPQYRWALRDWGKLPTAYTLPKAKKQYTERVRIFRGSHDALTHA